MKSNNLYLYIATLLVAIVITLNGCKKYLDVKPDKKLVIPGSLADLQAILDNYTVINNNDPSSGEISADNYYLTDADWASLSQENFRRIYTWQKDHVFANDINDWFYSYRTLYSANTVLDDVESFSKTGSQTDANNISGQAHFIRAKSLLQITVIFSQAYDPATAATDLGIPLRVNADFNTVSTRSTIRQTFDQIIQDLKIAIPLLPVTPVSVYRASKPAAYALLARSYLYLRQYDQAALYADSCLQLKNTLLDYNTLVPTASYPVSKLNSEVIFESMIPAAQPISNTKAKIDLTLYGSYDVNDLRKIVFFKNNNNGSFAFKGSYEASGNLFGGIATDEVYLMRAESNARLNKVTEAMSDLNALLIKRWKTGLFVPITANNQADALNKILGERRKELLMRGLRFMDIKRLNKEGSNITLTRNLNGQVFTLQPNDLRYALAIPENVILLSNVQQNPR
jgi:tetratricopeptide (TPR) repeat protein